MAKALTHSHTPEKLAAWDRGRLETLRDNARRLGAADVLQMCEEELARRAPRTGPKRRAASEHAEGDVVTGYHFVCARGRGVTELADGGSGVGLGSSPKVTYGQASKLEHISRCTRRRLSRHIGRVKLWTIAGAREI